MLSPAEVGSLGLGAAALLTSLANWRRTSAQNRVDREATTQKGEADLTDDQRLFIESLIGQIKTEREHAANLAEQSAKFFTELQNVRAAFSTLDARNWDLIREVDRLKSCDQQRLQELDELRAQNAQLLGQVEAGVLERRKLEDRIGLLEAELKKHGIEVPTPDRRRTDAELDQQALEREL